MMRENIQKQRKYDEQKGNSGVADEAKMDEFTHLI